MIDHPFTHQTKAMTNTFPLSNLTAGRPPPQLLPFDSPPRGTHSTLQATPIHLPVVGLIQIWKHIHSNPNHRQTRMESPSTSTSERNRSTNLCPSSREPEPTAANITERPTSKQRSAPYDPWQAAATIWPLTPCSKPAPPPKSFSPPAPLPESREEACHAPTTAKKTKSKVPRPPSPVRQHLPFVAEAGSPD
ncbi:pistil-specific extensin-like protein [Rosa chinensis]|uniref:pistil-specific extensin-like protein n=1 Tax=Rosa chinensis TaxID=74649 RepID=UPI000D08948D|nr:pistil-specific extensin-like protein [Rosa chinensis]